ncbi:OLC1v1008334C3 [Oldenlandia corymbosa var. corymbosa]|uniref:Splicing factor Cactin n=1 Tax=Oldenlandia corymbosa var. corymbosa TaxID=529605 RepID=A0AAV1DNU8_OLDCO|nr:OLC1v1008334C3 [Oldenlandia corymbosa var. corymbosa]
MAVVQSTAYILKKVINHKIESPPMAVSSSNVSDSGRIGHAPNRKRKEISEAEIASYLRKKASKQAARIAEKLRTRDSSNSDDKSDGKFVWTKKIEQDIIHGVPIGCFSPKAEGVKQRERIEELERLRKRRDERAFLRAQQEEAAAELGRERARSEFEDSEKKDEIFFYQQCRLKSKIRLKLGRPKPIDILGEYLNPSSFDELLCSLVDLGKEPWKVLEGLTLDELEELRDEISLYIEFDHESDIRVEFWKAVLVICEWQLVDANRRGAVNEFGVGGEGRISSSIVEEVRSELNGKSCSELEALEVQIMAQMRSGQAKLVEYWQELLEYLCFYKAKACLKQIHTNMMRNCKHPLPNLESSLIVRGGGGRLSSEPLEDSGDLERKVSKSMGSMEDGDALFGTNEEVRLSSTVVPDRSDDEKYSPRKPKYLNRVHSGYSWNKYNRTHYDHDNPPPKMVIGYKFNIFYPDLIDKSKCPTYLIEKDGDRTDTCILHFQAGPPYEDIAFRIVSKEWELSPRKGFKCTFNGGVLSLYFHFKQLRYRR